MTETVKNQGGEDPLKEMEAFVEMLLSNIRNAQQLLAERESLTQQVAALEEKNAKLVERLDQRKKEEDWASRVTYENVVEQIAACEDTKERDEARKLFEPLLKRGMVMQFRRDIKQRVKELNEESSGSTFNNYGTYTEVHPGGININNKQDAGD